MLQCKLPGSMAICPVHNVCKFMDAEDIFFGLLVVISVEVKYSLCLTIAFGIPSYM